MNPPTPGDRFRMSPGELSRAVHRVDELIAALETLDPAQLTPANDASIGHPGLADALHNAAPRWRRARDVLLADARRIAAQLHDYARTSQQNDHTLSIQLAQTDRYHTSRTDPGGERWT